MTTANLSEPELPAPPVEKELPAPQYRGDNPKVLIIILCVVLLASIIGAVVFLGK